MPLDSTAEDLMAAVQASPRAVAAHDKAAWVGLFGPDAAVNDPVGSRPHVGQVAIGRFYDTFIGPNTIAFDVRRDIVVDRTVVRDLSISTTMSTGATVLVPMHLRYDLAEVGGVWVIARLAAHWELAPMIGQLLRTGARGVGAAMKLGPQLVVNQGVGGAIGMMRALSSVGRAGKRRVHEVFTAAADADIARVRELLGARAVLESPAGTTVSVEDFVKRTRNMRWDKVIAAGRTVTATVDLGDAQGVAIIDFDPKTVAITRIGLYFDATP
ncbi:nuclear transport factor 2 family protein [Nocardia sp. NPDC005366]|uniref:nuclear transport factor 2 family protein n=1 Tax=Nocardia sp. NPDC005366 TaxID=3156878 RepID=UPI0033AD780A